MSDAPSYWGFLSYSHHDKAWADWLHKALEGYRVPSALIGRDIAAGRVPARLTPIFRDRDELPASDDLGGTITEALSRSRNLIVLCSPAAAHSRWTNQEILTFKRLRPDGDVFAVIVAGEPFASATPGREDEECFPPALRCKLGADGDLSDERAEPIAADLRDGGDGKKMGLLKLIAGMLGVGLDTLVRREAQRRQRRLALVAAASLAGMVVTSSLAIVAVRSRDEARDQRAAAEGLVGFMLGDLRAKLEPLGKLDTLDAVGARALKYYQGQNKADLSEEGLRQRARALTLIGEIANLRGDLDGALRRYTEARASTAEALRRAPDDEQRIFDHAQNVFWVGYIAWQRGNIVGAEEGFREYKRLAGRLIALNPKNPEWRLERIYADTNLGILLFNQRDYAGGARVFSAAHREAETLAARYPRDPRFLPQLVETLAGLADAQEGEGRLDDAIASRTSQLKVIDRLSGANPNDTVIKRKAMAAERAMGGLLVSRGDIHEGLGRLNRAVSIAETLRQTEPGNTEWLDVAASSHLDLGEELFTAGREDDAKATISAGCRIARALNDRDGSVRSWRSNLQRCFSLQAHVQARQGHAMYARLLARRTIALSPPRQPTCEDTEGLYPALSAQRLLGDLDASQGDDRAARAQWSAALTRLPDCTAETPLQQAARLALLKRLNRAEEANAIANRLRAMGYRQLRSIWFQANTAVRNEQQRRKQ